MKKRLALVIAIAVLFCSSCENQQVVEHGQPMGTGADTTVTEEADTTPAEDIGDITDNEPSDTDTTENVPADTEAEITEATKEAETTTVVEETTETEEYYEEEEYYEDEEYYEEEEEEEPEYDYDPAVVAEKVKSLNKTAGAIGDEVGAFLVKAVFSGYGMNLGGEGTFMSIYIEDGLWTISIDDTDYFNYTEEMEWFGYGEADSSTTKEDAEDPDTLLAIALVKKFPEIKNGSAGLWLQSGGCKAAYFTEDTTAGDGQIDFMLGEGGWIEKTCEWDGYNQGMSDEGNIVGTSPVLKFAVEE